MSLLTILQFPDPRLEKPAKPVPVVNGRIRQLAADMLETMYAAEGIGLAANQVNVQEQIIVMDISESRDQPLVLINPAIVWASPETRLGEEGCLSVPGIYDGVERALQVRVEALGLDGQLQTIKASGLQAVCIQHEMDHLLGKVFVAYLSPLKRSRIKSKMLKLQKERLSA